MHIQLDYIRIVRFKSFVQEQIFRPSATSGLKFVTGDNQVEPDISPNGAGKSTVWEALCWCLYNLTPSGDRASEAVSWGMERPEVEVGCIIDNQRKTILRKGGPNRLEIDGVAADQKAVDQLLLNYDRFVQSVLFGQSVPLFLDLPVQKRGELFDDILPGLTIWLDLAEIAAGKEAAALKLVAESDREVARLEGSIATLPDGSQLQLKADAWADARSEQLNEMIDEVAEAEAELEKFQKRAQNTEKKLKQRGDVPSEASRLNKLIADIDSDLRLDGARIKELTQQVQFYKDHETCPTCDQDITPQLVAVKLELAEKELARRDIKRAEMLQERKEYASKVVEARKSEDVWRAEDRELRKQLASAEATVVVLEHNLEKLLANVERLGNQKTNPHLSELAELEANKRAMKRELAKANLQRSSRKNTAALANRWKTEFKRVRLFLVKRILASLDAEVNSAANTLGLKGWEIKFLTETETKSGGLKYGINISIKSPQSEGHDGLWSGGEQQRIKLAASIGLSNLIQRMSNRTFGFEVWDEPTTHLSNKGVENLLECLDYRADVTNKSIWIVDHQALSHSSFEEIWQVVKTKDGSSIKLLNRAEP